MQMNPFFRMLFEWAFGESNPAPAAVPDPSADPPLAPLSPKDVELNLKLQGILAQGAGVIFDFGWTTVGPHAVAAAGYAHGCLCWMELWPEQEPELRIINGVTLQELSRSLDIIVDSTMRGSITVLRQRIAARQDWEKWRATGPALREQAEAQVRQYLATVPALSAANVSTGNARTNAEREANYDLRMHSDLRPGGAKDGSRG